VLGRACYYNELGNRIMESDFNITPEVTYITGATSVEFE
jgi:hypothetical protein